jgi:hypothetical protein
MNQLVGVSLTICCWGMAFVIDGGRGWKCVYNSNLSVFVNSCPTEGLRSFMCKAVSLGYFNGFEVNSKVSVSSTFPRNLNAVSLHKLRWRNVRMSIFLDRCCFINYITKFIVLKMQKKRVIVTHNSVSI